MFGTGVWHKIAIQTNGVYKIDQNWFRKAGIDPASVDPRNIRIFGTTGGMLPQANNSERPSLNEIAILVKGQEDGVFNADDQVLFYAAGPDAISFSEPAGMYRYEKNLYADHSYVFLHLSDQPGKRIAEAPAVAGNFPVVSHFHDVVFHEADLHNELKSGRFWYGEKFDLTTDRTLSWEVSGIRENSTIRIASEVMAQTGATSTFKLTLNGAPVGDQAVLPISTYLYGLKGQIRRDTFQINSNSLSIGGDGLSLNYQYVKAGSGRSIGYLDRVAIGFERSLSLYGDMTIFNNASGRGNPYSTFQITALKSPVTIWDVTDALTPLAIPHQQAGSNATFNAASSSIKTFVVFGAQVPSPEHVGIVPNQNLRAMQTPEAIIVTHPLFKDHAERLAAHRRQTNGWQVSVVTPEEIYNEFSGGRQDVTAIRDFVRHLYLTDPGKLKSLVLFGRSSYDYKDRVENNTNFVPTYESRNSLSPLETYSSDDYFGMLEEDEGTWAEGETPDYHTLDIGVGRLPVKTSEEAAAVVDKIIDYETKASNLGNWRKQIVFVADDGDLISPNLHQRQADQLAAYVSAEAPEFDARKIYLDAFEQELRPAGEASPSATKKVLDAIDKGALIVNYTGHGTEKIWAAERIFDDFMIERLENENYALFVTATCEFGRQDDPRQISSAELAVLRKNSGAIGMVTTARPVNASTNFELNKAFYETLLADDETERLTLGEIFRQTKNKSISGVSNRNFSLLGDPSMALAIPRLKTRVTSIQGGEDADTLRALSQVVVKGEIVNDAGDVQSHFNGVLHVEVFDKQREQRTLGNEGPPFTYEQWESVLFRGKATVADGLFSFSFIVPKNIAYSVGKGKMSLYASDKRSFTDAGGADVDFVVGQSESNPGTDASPPVMRAYIGDTTFINGGIASPDTRLVVSLQDESGITITNYGIGNGLVGVLDDGPSFPLDEYYVAETDDYTRGWIDYPLRGLPPGKHTITVRAWDVFNNGTTVTVDFVVSDGLEISIESFLNYPNPFSSSTTLFFTHNRSGDDLFTEVAIYDITGKLLKTQAKTVTGSPYEVELLTLDTNEQTGENLKAGLYFARLLVRSLSNGSKNERVTKLIVTN